MGQTIEQQRHFNEWPISELHGEVDSNQTSLKLLLCPFAEYYLLYAVTSFFTISRISLADGKRAGQKLHRTIAVAVQNAKPL